MTRFSSGSRLAAYAAAAGPLVANTVCADVIVVDLASAIDVTISYDSFDLGPAGLGLNPGFPSFQIVGVGGGWFYCRVLGTTASGLSGSGFVATSGVRPSGAAFGSSENWRSGWGTFTVASPGETGYVGFCLKLGSDVRYGWVEFVNGSDSLSVSRWAYETELNTNIVAGATGTPAVPGLGGLAALAMGAAGVRRNRNRVA